MSNPISKYLESDVWQKFIHKKSALLGFLIILVSFIVSLFAFLIIPDKSHQSNRQIPALALRPPGFSVDCIKLTRNVVHKRTTFLNRLLYGAAEKYIYLPVINWSYDKDLIRMNMIDGSTSFYQLADIIYPLHSSQTAISSDESISFRDIEGQQIKLTLDSAKNTFQTEHLTKISYLLGSDRYGRDILSRLILGIRTSLLVGCIAILISLIVGISLGSIGGFFGGKTDHWVMLLINTSWSIPTLLLVFAIVLALGRGITIIFIAVGLTMWVDVARIVRGEVMKLKQQEFIEAARVIGQKSSKIITKHILPNILGPVLVITAANFAIAILLEAGLSFLGFGVKPPSPSLGNLLNENYGYAISGKSWLAITPALSIMMLVLSFNLVGSGLRDAFDVKSES